MFLKALALQRNDCRRAAHRESERWRRSDDPLTPRIRDRQRRAVLLGSDPLNRELVTITTKFHSGIRNRSRNRPADGYRLACRIVSQISGKIFVFAVGNRLCLELQSNRWMAIRWTSSVTLIIFTKTSIRPRFDHQCQRSKCARLRLNRDRRSRGSRECLRLSRDYSNRTRPLKTAFRRINRTRHNTDTSKCV